MTRKAFKEIMKELILIMKYEDDLNKSFKKFNPNFNYVSLGVYQELIVKTLTEALDDKGDWIEYFIYERSCKFTNKNIIQDKNGKNIPFRNYDDLYNLIKKI